MERFKRCLGQFEEIVINGKRMFKCNKCGRIEKDYPYKGICQVSVCAYCGKRLSACTCPKDDKKRAKR